MSLLRGRWVLVAVAAIILVAIVVLTRFAADPGVGAVFSGP